MSPLAAVLPSIQAGGIQPNHFRWKEEHSIVKVLLQNQLEHTCSSFDSHLTFTVWPSSSHFIFKPAVKHPFPFHSSILFVEELWVRVRSKRFAFQHVFVHCFTQQELNASLIQITNSRCTLPAGLLPVMFPVTRKKHWLLVWMEGGDRVWGAFIGVPHSWASWSPAIQELSVPPCKAKGPLPNLQAKSVITLIWTHLHFPSWFFLHLLFQQLSLSLISPQQDLFLF